MSLGCKIRLIYQVYNRLDGVLLHKNKLQIIDHFTFILTLPYFMHIINIFDLKNACKRLIKRLNPCRIVNQKKQWRTKAQRRRRMKNDHGLAG